MSDSTATGTISRHAFPFAQIPHALIEDPDLSHTAVRIYCYLMRRADNTTGNAFPGIRLIAKEINMSPSTVSKGIAELDDRGWIDVSKRMTKKQRHLANDYLVRTTRRGVSEIGTPVTESGTGGVAESSTELEPVLTTTNELSEAATPRTVMKDSLVAAMGWNPKELTPRQWDKVEVAAKQLCDIDADPTEVQRRASVYRVNFRGATMTPIAIATNWADLAEPRIPVSQRELEDAAANMRQKEAFAELERQLALEEQ